MDWIIGALKLKILIHWLIIYIIVNVIEFIVMKVVFKWMFSSSKDEAKTTTK